jgi:hypothetical protein
MTVALTKFCAIGASVIGRLGWASLAATEALAPGKAAHYLFVQLVKTELVGD